MRRRVLIAACVATALVVAAFVGTAVARQVGWLPDERAFRSYVLEHVDGWSDSRYPHAQDRDRVWVDHHMAAVVTEGHRSCDWLRARSDAPDSDPLGKFNFDAILGRYLRESESTTKVRLHKLSRGTVGAGAWAYLCLRVRDAKTSHVEEPD